MFSVKSNLTNAILLICLVASSFLNVENRKYIRKSGGIGIFVKQPLFLHIPPNDSKFYNSDEMENFNVEITNMCMSNKYVFFIG